MAKLFNINRELIPIKLHYFLFFGAMAGVLPYMSVLAKGLGISATALSIVLILRHIFISVSKIFFGYLTDYFQNIKAIVFILVLFTTIFNLLILLIPPLNGSNDKIQEVQLQCNEDSQLSLFPFEYDELCLKKLTKQGINCKIQFTECKSHTTTILSGRLNEMKFEVSNTEIRNSSKCTLNVGRSRLHLPFNSSDNFNCSCIKDESSFIKEAKPSMHSCICKNETQTYSYQFWIFTLLYLLSGAGIEAVFSLSDSACFEILGDNSEYFGRQRLWATVSWGIIASISGYLNSLTTGPNIHKDYSAGFYVMFVFVIIDLFLLFKLKLSKANFSTNIWKDIGTIFASSETVIFAVAVYIIGTLTTLTLNYEFWFLEDLGATQTLLGLSTAVQSLVAEVPMFILSGWFIETFGHFYCLASSFVAFALRLAFYSLLENPWLVLPVEILDGFTYALFIATMTSYASINAPLGTEATMVGIMGGIYSGLGGITGSLLGGLGFDKLGGRYTFLIAAAISFLCVPALLISRLLIQLTSCKKERRSTAESINKTCD